MEVWIVISILLMITIIVVFWNILPEGRPVLAIMDIVAVVWLLVNILDYYR